MTVALAVLSLALVGALTHAYGRFARTLKELEQTHALERANLLDRIQAPEVAVAHHAAEGVVDEPAVHPDLPEEYWQAIERVQELERTG